MKHKEKPKYGIGQNVCFMLRTAWSTYKSVLVLCVAAAVIQVALNLAQIYVTPEILAKVEQRASIGELLTTIGIFAVVLFLLQGAGTYCTEVRMPAEIVVRVAIIRRGRLIASGTMDEVKGDQSLEAVFLELEAEK